MTQPLFQRQSEQNESWIAVSDLMAGLMMVFLLIAVIYARDAGERGQDITGMLVDWQDTEMEICNALEEEFKYDLPKWNAKIECETLTIRFRSPDILFETGKAELTPQFRSILDDFMPRYLDLLHSRFRKPIQEIRIEGHTSSEWLGATTRKQAFILNMALSQARTRAVLDHTLQIESILSLTPWITKTVSANGLSSARLVMRDGEENKVRSRRVEFAIRTRSKEALVNILREVAPPVIRAF